MNEREIFVAALERESEAERREYLKNACGGDRSLHNRIEGLLAERSNLGSFLESPAELPSGTATLIGGTAGRERPGDQIGPFKLRERIGEGGFGTVYVAEQKTPVARKVALKVIKPGMDTQEVIARFEAERQALAMMDHPNVAKVLDAGSTESGRPFFVMELVRGVTVTEFCDQQKLDTDTRLRLFTDICRAVLHAHQKGIIHRDLKPSNILVTMHDDRPVVKVIDFGVAKALSQKLTDHSIYTSYGQMVGTPMYMSPEQAQLSGLDVDTRSDVYSLGVVLYELLTGTTPFDKNTLKKANYDELRRIIQEDDPPLPSARLSTLDKGLLSTIGDRRRIDPRKLGRSLRGELDWIVMKALEKDRNRRYESASAFAADVERLLAHQPVEACPPSALYRLRKFAKRNMVALGTTALVMAALFVGAGVSIWQARVAHLAQKRAEAQTGRAEETLVVAREAVDFAVMGFAKAVSSHPDAEKLAEGVYGPAIDFYGDLIRLDPEDPANYYSRANALIAKGRFAEAIEDCDRALDLDPSNVFAIRVRGMAYRSLGEDFLAIDDFDRAIELDDSNAMMYSERAECWYALGEYDKALADFNQSISRNPNDYEVLDHRAHEWVRLEEFDKAIADFTTFIRLQPNSPEGFHNRAATWFSKGEPDKAIEDAEAALRIHPDDVFAYRTLAQAWQAKGDFEKAIASFDKAVRLKPDDAATIVRRAIAWEADEDYEKAMDDYRRAIDVDSTNLDAHNNLGILWQMHGDYLQAIKYFTKAIKIDPDAYAAYFNRGTVYGMGEQYEKSLADLNKAIQLNPNDYQCYGNRGNVWSEKGEYAKAAADYREAIRLNPKNDVDFCNLAWLLATCPDAEIRDGEQAVKFATKACVFTDWSNAECLDALAAAYAETGDFSSAIKWESKALMIAEPELRADYRARLALYESDMPYRDE